MNTIYFKREEFACKCGCGFDTVDVDLLPILIDLRSKFKSPVIITSGCRCYEYNRKVGSKYSSQHTKGKAADITVKGYSPEQVYDYLTAKYPNKYGFGLYKTFVHVDSRDVKARWSSV